MPISRGIFSGTMAAALLAVAGCGVASETPAPRSIALADDLVLLGAPGYCADLSSVDLMHDPQVVLFGSCAALKNSPLVRGPDVPGLVTVAVSKGGAPAPSADVLEDYLSSPSGRAQLSRSGDAASVEVLQTRRRDGILLMHATDTSPGLPPGTLPEQWRAMMSIDDRLISISVLSFADSPMTTDLAFATLAAQCDRIRRANLN